MMKKINFLVIVALLTLVACGKKEESEKLVFENEDVSVSISEETNTNEEIDELDQIENKLKGLTPMSLENLKAFFPSEIDGFKSKDVVAMKIEGASNVSIQYEKQNQNITIMLYDGAGEGSSLVSRSISDNLNNAIEMETKNSKLYTEEFRKSNAMITENFEVNQESSTLIYVENERYYIQVIGSNISINDLKSFINKFNFSALE